MTKVDQFESVFRAAAKPVYTHERIEIRSVLVITDLEPTAVEAFASRVRAFLGVLGDDVQWRAVGGEAFRTVGDLLDLVEREAPDLVSTYRHLKSDAWRWPYGLGEHLDVLTQAARPPVLVLPHPLAGRASAHALEDTNVVMAMTDHLAGDARLVNHAVRFTRTDGTLYLTHVEDHAVFERYLEVISKIPAIDTDTAREEILGQLLKEPGDYIRSSAAALEAAGVKVRVAAVVTSGDHLREHRRLVDEHRVDLLVMNTKDEEQLAMHGRAYPLAVELRAIPLLLL